ncbi:hypothetical protein O9K51_11215 [Purpureocillium lavendulum]|uniref:Uncharacterized protein n=1 Tax=Purpureocillium lavendulum TaxID=1247861 RepID=A0AB34FCA4_9HYPO|nr:hypothetical protein O9K51_11215 [Purpureocillium lavendulum]
MPQDLSNCPSKESQNGEAEFMGPFSSTTMVPWNFASAAGARRPHNHTDASPRKAKAGGVNK